MCKCQVLDGGGEILPTEVNFFTRRQQAEKWRLGCQVKVKEDLKIRVGDAVLGVKKWECEVVSNNNVATFIKEFVVKLPVGETLKFRSGQYIQIDVPNPNQIIIKGIDKEKVGQFAAEVRAKRPPEPYKGKGIKYDYEHIRRKEGKTGAK